MQWLVCFLWEFVRNHEKERSSFCLCLLNQFKYYISKTDDGPLRLNTSISNSGWYIMMKVVVYILILVLFVKLLREILVTCTWTTLLCIHITVIINIVFLGLGYCPFWLLLLIHIHFWIFLLWLTVEHK